VTNNPGGRFEDYYRLMEAELGKGQFSTVKRAVEISTKREVRVAFNSLLGVVDGASMRR